MSVLSHAEIFTAHPNHTQTQHTPHLVLMESHAAFENAISEQPNLVFDGWIPPMDWTNIDLLDACYDLVPYGMGLGR